MKRKRILLETMLIVILALGGVGTFEFLSDGPRDGLHVGWPQGQFIDLGDVPAGTATREVSIRNDGPTELVIGGVKGSCACMKVSMQSQVLQPGDVGKCSVSLFVDAGQRRTALVYFEIMRPVRTVMSVTV